MSPGNLLVAFIFFLLLILNVSGVLSATFTVTNKCNQTVWPAILSSTNGTSPLNTTGFQLQNDESRNVTVPSSWTGRFWGRTHCSTQNSTGGFSCISGDCGSGKVECSGKRHSPPATLAEFSLTSPGTGLDFYDVSLVDGFNLPILVVPESGNCSTTGCAVDLNDVCPPELKATSQDGIDVGCRSACEVSASPQYCCTGAYNTPETCKPTSYSKFFKNACPRAYSYAFDDSTTSIFRCPSTNYAITFCPPTSKKPTKNPEPRNMGATFTVTNKCNQTVWPALSTTNGTSPLTTGFQLQNDESRNVTVPSSWNGRFWGRTHCSTQNPTGRFSCISGDCGSGKVQCSGNSHSQPVTLAEFSLTVPGMGLDSYNVSFVDGTNLPMLVVPESGNCTTAGCDVDLNDVCPIELKATSQDGIDVGCKSACEAFADPKYCCIGAYGTPDTCKPTPYSKFFKNACPRAYSYPFDDRTSDFRCASTNYAITFCPPLPTIENPTKNPEAAGGGGSLGPVSSSSTVRASFVQFPGGAVSLFILLSSSALWKLF